MDPVAKPPAPAITLPTLDYVPLSPTEARFLSLYIQGFEYKEIADKMQISVNTAKTHGARIKGKLRAFNLRHAGWRLSQLQSKSTRDEIGPRAYVFKRP